MTLAAGLVGAALGAAAMAMAPGAQVSGADRAAIEKIVHDYILEHPEILPEAMDRLQAKQVASVVKDNRAALQTPFKGAWAGAADGDVVLVEFFDYACGYCRASQPDIERLLKEDRKLKIVWREFPVLGDDSQKAALASLAVAESGKYQAFHNKMFELDRPSDTTIKAAGAAAGVDTAKAVPAAAKTAYQNEIEKNYSLARALNLTGTPAFVVGDQVLQGAVGYEALKKAIADARAAK